MSNDSTTASKAVDGESLVNDSKADHLNHVAPELHSPRRSQSTSSRSHRPQKNGHRSANGERETLNGRSDSEAETVVLSGKEELSTDTTKKVIKNEAHSDGESTMNVQAGVRPSGSTRLSAGSEDNVDRPSLKRKRVTPPYGAQAVERGISSNLSSTISSPTHRSHTSPERHDSDSSRSRTSPPRDETKQQRGVNPQKRKLREGAKDVNGKERRMRRSDGGREKLADRSESPQSNSRHTSQTVRAISTELSSSLRQRKPPISLSVGHRRKTSEETRDDSDDSISTHGHPRLRKLVLTDNITSAKMPPHKKNRDKNGRTVLARTCATEEKNFDSAFEDIKLMLRERPEDLNVPDYAGNTPLQIASLAGNVKIVQFLIDAGCDTSSRNIDMETPLMDAAEVGHLEVVKLLLKAGLDPRQTNAKGEESLDLLKPDLEHFDAIREALISAKEKDTRRRSSVDQGQHGAGARDTDGSSRGASAASPGQSPALHSARSPPASATLPRRRIGRGQATRDELLWINPTPDNLRDRAGKGDLDVVNYILSMRPIADTESVLAAAKGGHEVVLELLIALGSPQPDPDPLQSSNHKPAFSTPMLAAIGRENLGIIRLLLEQKGFDPTRRLYRGLTYYELAKERQGPCWQEEYEILKEAFDRHASTGSIGCTSPRKARGGGLEPKNAVLRKVSSPLANDGITQETHSAMPDDPAKHKRLQLHHKESSPKYSRKSEIRSRESSAVVSDREAKPLGPPKAKSRNRSMSDASVIAEVSKPKRKLLSRNDLQHDEDTKRRASVVSETSTTSSHGPTPKSDEPPKSKDTRHDTSEETSRMHNETGKKRSRNSGSSSEHNPSQPPDMIKKKKRRRVDSICSTSQEHHVPPVRRGSAAVARMVASPDRITSPVSSTRAAPVAFMGGAVSATPLRESSINSQTHQDTSVSPLTTERPTPQTLSQQKSPTQQTSSPKSDLENALHQHNAEVQTGIEVRAREERERAEEDRRRQVQAAREEAEYKNRIAREEEDARTEEQRRIDEAERQARLEREEEKARIERSRREEELQRRRVEQERIRREEQERRRIELEERESLRRIRMQEEKERERRESLPNGLRRAAELSVDEARDVKEVAKWLPIYTATTHQLNPQCEDQVADERWIPNFQAAPILAIKDLDLSQCEPTVSLQSFKLCHQAISKHRYMSPKPHSSQLFHHATNIYPRYSLVLPSRHSLAHRLSLASLPHQTRARSQTCPYMHPRRDLRL